MHESIKTLCLHIIANVRQLISMRRSNHDIFQFNYKHKYCDWPANVDCTPGPTPKPTPKPTDPPTKEPEPTKEPKPTPKPGGKLQF